MSTTSGTHGGEGSGESRDDGEELSTPAVKRQCVREEDSMLLVSGLRRDGESVAPTGIVHHQHHNHPQQHSYLNHFQAGHPSPQLPNMSLLPV